MSKRKSVDLLPVIFRTDANEKFLTGTIDQLIEKPTLKKVDGFIGDKIVGNYKPGTDSYINDGSDLRTRYELEPGIVTKNAVTDQVEFNKTFEDIINSLKYFNADTSNQDKLFRQQSYAWNTFIDLDKFVNFRNYVWLPNGPSTVRISGKEKEVTSTIKVKIVDDNWNFSTNEVAVNPTITLYRGFTYIFEVDTVDQPFYIKNKRSSGDVDSWDGVQNNGTTSGSVIFNVVESTPSTLFYVNGNDNTLFGRFLIRDQKDNTELDVENEIIGKKTYEIKDGIHLSNGMKIVFSDTVFPEKYRDKTYIVEGVGNSITLVDYNSLLTIEGYSTIVETSFDETSFDELPFDEVSEYPVNPDYILINRASEDKNPWSRYNRWFHIDVVNTSALLNSTDPTFTSFDRAQRPIIEFRPNMQLFNFSKITKYVNFLDDTVTDAFSSIEGSLGYYIDGKALEDGNRIVFLSDTDLDVKNKIFQVQFIDINGVKKLHLEETEDALPNLDDGLLVINGIKNGRTSWVYKNGEWIKSQQKEQINQSPLFDIFDSNGISFSNSDVYTDTNFSGSRVFGYQIGVGSNDSILGFPLVYKTVSNVGGYTFENCLSEDTFEYFVNGQIVLGSTKNGFLKENNNYVNGWVKCNKLSIQEIIDQRIALGGEDAFEFDSIDIRTPKEHVRVFKNGKQLTATEFDVRIDSAFDSFFITLSSVLVKNDVIVIRVLPTYDKKEEGYYETPINLVNNPTNDFPEFLSYAEINDHLNSIILNASKDLNTVIDRNNLRDLANLDKYGRRFVQHDGLVSMAGAVIANKEYNLIHSLRWSALEYQRYKTLILQKFIELAEYADIPDALDKIILSIAKDKTPASMFYYSDMLPYGLNKRDYTYTVNDTNIRAYAYGSEIYDRFAFGKKAILVYVNGEQLIIDKDYSFDLDNPLVRFVNTLSVNDKILIRVFNNIHGAVMPMSPTKLGLYPSFEPSIYLDDTYIEPTQVIQGHDGSVTVCFGDDRDQLLLELEKRIFNNLKVEYDPRILDVNEILPSIFRKTGYTSKQFDNAIEDEFLKWIGIYSIDYRANENEIYLNNFGFKYLNSTGIIDRNSFITGSWRKVYKHYYDTDRPHSHPWEMLGFYKKPTWWEAEYGPAPYTSGNDVMWKDLEQGYIRAGVRKGYDEKYARPGLSNIIPVDSYGILKDPIQANTVKDFDYSARYTEWSFGDMGPAETAWRRSDIYPFAVQIAMALIMPAKYATLGFDTSRNVFNIANQIVYKDSLERLSPAALKVFSNTIDNNFVYATGYHPYIVENLRQRFSNPAVRLQDYLNRIQSNLIYKVGGFTSKDKFRVALETVTSYKTVDKVYVPEENYQLVLSTGSPTKTLTMSGIIVERTEAGYMVRGYDSNSPYFAIKKAIHATNDPVISVGGVTEPFIYWSSNATVNAGLVVANGQQYYRAISTHLTKQTFEPGLYYPLPYLPSVGGVEAFVANSFEDVTTIVPYGTKYNSIQDVFDFILGYGEYVKSEGFKFENLLPELDVIADWKLAGKEFLFWSLQNWSTSSVISLSPFAEKIYFTSENSVVDDLYDSFYDYTLLKADGTSIDRNKVSISRQEGSFIIDTAGTTEGVYFVKISLVQKEHVVVFDNKTIFNDLIYEPTSGYRQKRFKIKGFMTDGWKGDFYIPGFVYDSAKINDWEPNIDYEIGNVVRYQTKYYQAKARTLAREIFNYEDWTLLGKQPVAQLLPNFEYKISQFEEFYSLDSVNFDNSQQKYAQKLIGYVPRTYLNSLIPDESSQYKFYQGFIREKGTTLPLEKFAVANNSATGAHISLQEEWAIRLGTFGGENSYEEIEFTLDQNKLNQDPQIFEFEYNDLKSSLDKAYKVPLSDMQIHPADYNGRPWPTLDVSPVNGNGYSQYQKIPSAGYVRLDDVVFTGLYENNILTLSSSSSLREGDTVWLAIDNSGNWGVKRYTLSPVTIINYTVDNANNLISFNTDVAHKLKLRDFVSISRLDDPLNGVYEVIGIPDGTTFVVKTAFNDIPAAGEILTGSMYYFATSRFSKLDDLASIPGLARWQNCEFVWVDDVGDGTWAVLEKEANTKALPIRPRINQSGQKFGNTTIIAPVSKNIIVSATELERGRVYVYERNALGSEDIILHQSYLLEENFSDILTIQDVKNGVGVPEMQRLHGASLDCWENTALTIRYIVSGAPNSSNAKWKVLGQSVEPIRKVLEFNKSSSELFEEGAIKIVKFNNELDAYRTEAVLASPIAQAEAKFGHKVKFVGSDKPTLLVSAPGQDGGLGAIFVYYLDSNNLWQVYTVGGNPYNIRSEVTNINSKSNFGSDIVCNKDGTILAVSAPDHVKDRTQVHSGAVFIFRKDAGSYSYQLSQTIYADDYLESDDLLLKGVIKSYNTVAQIISFQASDNSLVRNTGSFIADGFRIGQAVIINGSTNASNNGEFVISELSVLRMAFKPLRLLNDETATTTITITGQGTIRNDRFGDKLSMSADGTTLLISSDHSSTEKLDAGLVYVLKLQLNSSYALDQKITSPATETGELFGSNLALSEDGNTLLVTAIGGGQATPVAFDTYTERYVDSEERYGSEYTLNPTSTAAALRTTFDSGSTRFVSKAVASGAVYLYQRLGTKYVFGESLISGDSASFDGYGTGIATDGEFILVGAPRYDLKVIGTLEDSNQLTTYTDSGTVVIFDKKRDIEQACGCGSSWSWSKVRVQEPIIDTDKIKKVISYDNNTLEIVDYYEIYDPVKGKLPSKVLNEIKYIQPFDPAIYTVALETSAKVRVDNKTTWLDDHVGEVWLDTSTLRFVWYEQGDNEFRANNWGKLFPGSTVDVYEWVKSDFRPSEWAQLADTTDGLALGVSGQPLNPDNTVLSINQYFDPVVNDFVNVYYFWVRNKITLPDLEFRNMTSFDCARIIEDPKGQGIKFASFLATNSLSLTNAKKSLNGNKINIDVYYQTSDKEINRHSHWQLVNENVTYLNLDPSIENKLIDSLVGQDVAGNPVPDPEVSPKLRYGTSYRPRQSWFKDRDLALKIMIEYVNEILLKHDIVGKANLAELEKVEDYPSISLGHYDEVIELSDEISSIGTNGKVQTKLSATVVNGKIVRVNIDDPGNGYKVAPTVQIYGTGQGANIQTAIDLNGRVVSVRIVNQGYGYTETPKLIARPYSVLTVLDTEIDKWAIYQYKNKSFVRESTQTINVPKYWSYVDWVDPSYAVDVPATYATNFISDLESFIFETGSTVEIRTPGDGRRIIVRKTTAGTGNYLDDYDLVFRENGTVQFNNKLYDKIAAGLGFDNVTRYDQGGFDETNTTELRIILNAIKDNIFVGDLASYWKKFVFVAIRHVLSEQLFVDWVYKTSFITPFVDAGTLDQDDVYRFNDFSYVEDFIKEIKPYKSKFRESTVGYNTIEKIGVGVTDFDLPAYVDSITGAIKLPTTSMINNVYPYKHWGENYGFTVSDIRIGLTGQNYITPPIVTIVPVGGDPGTGATAIAKISNGKLSSIIVTNPGRGYLTTPKVILTGGSNYLADFVNGSAYAVLSNSKVRSNQIQMKFDRTSDTGLYTGEILNRNVDTDGVTLNYVLTYPSTNTDTNYPALQDESTIKLFLNDAEISADNYRITFRNDLSTVITFNLALPARQNLRIQYIKNTLYTVDTFTQSSGESYTDTFKLTFPPDLDTDKIIVRELNASTNTGSEIITSDYLIQLKQIIENGFTKYVGYIKFKNIPNPGSTITVQYAKNINIQNAVDRIITSYYPTANMPGKDVTQLIKGVEFGGVEIQGLNFTVSSGWDGLPWFTQGWDTFVNSYKDLLVISDGTTTTYDLGYTPLLGTKINVYFDGVRVDDENYGTVDQTNSDALFKTITTSGSTSTLTLPQVPSSGIKIEIRQELSDGVNLPTDDIVLDTNITGGDFSTILDAGEIRFRTATGLSATDISLDGGEFLSVEHSPSTEELVKGEIFDTLSMTVFNSPGAGSNLISTKQFIMDGSTMQFVIQDTIGSGQEIFVLIGNFVAKENTDYTLTSNVNGTTTVTIITNEYGIDQLSATNTLALTVQKTTIGGSNILSRFSYTVTSANASATSFEILSDINYQDIGSYYISISNTSSITKAAGRSKRAKIIITNTPTLTAGTVINILLFGSTVKTYSEIYNQEIVIDNNTTYTLTKPPGNIAPLHVMAAVTRLTSSTEDWKGPWLENVYYTINDTVLYNNVSYICKIGHTSTQTNSELVFPAWASTVSYDVNDIVSFSGQYHICKVAHTSNTTTLTPDNIIYWGVHITNRPDEDTSRIYWGLTPTQRMMPPETEYYEVTQNSQTFRLGENIPYLTRTLSISDIEVYKNGKIIVVGRDYEFNTVNNTITMSSGVAQVGDVVAVCVLRDSDYVIFGNQITFRSPAKIQVGQRVSVVTYTNHDENLIRREVFKTNPNRNEYKLSRPVYNINNVWVDVNGRPLIPNYDYQVVDKDYIQISNRFNLGNNDRVVVTSISDIVSSEAVSYRMFKDMTNAVQFKRLSKNSTVTLTKALMSTDREIEVSDTSIFGVVNVNNPKPSSIFIAGERIEFRSIVGNKLTNLTRGTLGTGVADSYPVGTKVFNVGNNETIPYREGYTIKTYKTPENYKFNQTTNRYQQYVNGNWVNVTTVASYTLTDFTFNDTIGLEDQVTVYMAGKVLTKPVRGSNQLIKHDFSITHNSDEVNSQGQSGDLTAAPDFVIEKVGNNYVLTVNPSVLSLNSDSTVISNVDIKVVQKIGKIWYTLGGTTTIQQESTPQARFLQEFTSELPDKYYYGKLS
jgi:hypothetical protein